MDALNYNELLQKKELFEQQRKLLPSVTVESYQQAFDIEYTHDSTAIEGNTLSLIETKVVLEDGVAIGGKSLREIYEVVNHSKAFRYVRQRVAEHKPLDENTVKDIHALLMNSIMVGGVYRNVDVYISGARHTPPTPNEMFRQIKAFYGDLTWKGTELSPVELAAWTHAEFVKIHPFTDGNGRTSRLIMNYQLMANGFPPVSISKENRLAYFEALESYAADGNLSPFSDMIAGLEDIQLNRYLGMLPEQEQEQEPEQGQNQQII